MNNTMQYMYKCVMVAINITFQAAFNRPGSSYIIQNPLVGSSGVVDLQSGTGGISRRGQQMDSVAMAACLSGDVLAGLPYDQPRRSDKAKKTQLGIWRAS